MIPHTLPAARARRALSHLLLGLSAWFCLAAMAHAEPSLAAKRIAFKQAWTVAQRGGDG